MDFYNNITHTLFAKCLQQKPQSQLEEISIDHNQQELITLLRPHLNRLKQNQQEKPVQVYLNLLLRLYRKGIPALEIVNILGLKDEDGFTLGMRIANGHSEDNLGDYLELLKLMREENKKISSAIEILMMYTTNQIVANEPGQNVLTTSFAELVAQHHQAAVLFKVITSGLLSPETYQRISHHLAEILDYIFSLPNWFLKKNALRDLLDPSQPLGSFIACHPNVDLQTIKADIQQQLNSMEKSDHLRWQQTLFMPVQVNLKTEELPQYFDLIDPYEPYKASLAH